MDYELLDSGQGFKLERFGNYTLSRPSGIALWDRTVKTWDPDASFTRFERWDCKPQFPESWTIDIAGVHMRCKLTDFGHLGVFPEHAHFWKWMQERAHTRPLSVLNLFAYSGGATLALAKAGAQVCHLDSSKGMVDWARENCKLNNLENAPIRWIVDDALKFMQREIKRGKRYDAIILDPPSFGRGAKGEVFKIEDDIPTLLSYTQQLLSDKPDFILFSCHTPGFTPQVLQNLMPFPAMTGEMLLHPKKGPPLPSGTYAQVTL